LENTSDWRRQLKNLIRTPEDLARLLNIPVSELSLSQGRIPRKTRVTPYYAGLIEAGNINDPLLKQVMPVDEKDSSSTNSSLDPLAERAHTPVRGLVHRYPDRVLLVPSGLCPVNCRFCLRKRAWSDEPVDPDFDAGRVLAYIGACTGVHDVIISGGDPLLLPMGLLEEILHGLSSIPHVDTVRIGSRSPATLPMRIDQDVEDLLRRFRPVWFLTHFNHPRELTAQSKAALERLLRAGAILNNQSVLLKGVNDSASTLIALSRELLAAGVRPYYLHHLDPVKGTDRFRVPIERGKEIIRSMFGRLSGLGIPRYVVDLPGGKGKVPLMPDFQKSRKSGKRAFEAPLGSQAAVFSGKGALNCGEAEDQAIASGSSGDGG